MTNSFKNFKLITDKILEKWNISFNLKFFNKLLLLWY